MRDDWSEEPVFHAEEPIRHTIGENALADPTCHGNVLEYLVQHPGQCP